MIADIYVTLGKEQLSEKPYREQIENFLMCKGDNGWFFWWRLPFKPKRDFQWVYIVIGNRVRWRARFVDHMGAGTKEFSDGSSMHSNHWITLIDFEKLPRPYEVKKGFQGFRYKYS